MILDVLQLFKLSMGPQWILYVDGCRGVEADDLVDG
jgi:hypothetical protein